MGPTLSSYTIEFCRSMPEKKTSHPGHQIDVRAPIVRVALLQWTPIRPRPEQPTVSTQSAQSAHQSRTLSSFKVSIYTKASKGRREAYVGAPVQSSSSGSSSSGSRCIRGSSSINSSGRYYYVAVYYINSSTRSTTRSSTRSITVILYEYQYL